MTNATDFETYSAVDLRTAGLDNYSKDKSTGIHCLSWGNDPFELQTWTEGDPFPEDLREYVEQGGIFTAWNAAFEISMWLNCAVRRYGWPAVKPEQFRCSMAQAYAMSLPGSLERAALALGVAEQKDMKGARVMMQLAQPKADGTFWTRDQAPEKFQQLYEYNRQDVRTELAARERMMELSDDEQKLWTLDYTINQRGIQIDLEAVNAAIKLVAAEKARLDREMLRTTGGVVGACSEVQLLVKWIRSQGVEVKGLAKADVLDALSGELPAHVRTALALRKEAAKSSTAKLVAMKERAGPDGRVRGTMQYHGANTGRWAGRGIQVQNFPRGNLKPEHVEDAVAHFNERDYLNMMYDAPLDVLASCLRAMIVAKPGHDLVAADFSAIEARVLAWLAGEEKVLEIFRTHGKIYEHAAAGIYHVPMDAVTKAQRQIGKVAVLALGYGGGIGAFQSMARNYAVKVADQEADDIKKAWREAHPRIVAYWHDLESAAINACELGVVCKSGPAGRQVAFVKRGSFLWCKLPSGRVLCYPYPAVKEVPVPWGGTKPALHYMSVNGTTNKWEETSTYGGSLAENVTQAVARDLLAHGMTLLEHHGYPVIMHVHDEAVVEIASNSDDGSLKRIESLMSQTPSWAAGLPVIAEGWRARRYRK
jgi:DNA polymerase bacteriophage-type